MPCKGGVFIRNYINHKTEFFCLHNNTSNRIYICTSGFLNQKKKISFANISLKSMPVNSISFGLIHTSSISVLLRLRQLEWPPKWSRSAF